MSCFLLSTHIKTTYLWNIQSLYNSPPNVASNNLLGDVDDTLNVIDNTLLRGISNTPSNVVDNVLLRDVSITPLDVDSNILLKDFNINTLSIAVIDGLVIAAE